MVSAFAVETYVEHHNLEAHLEWIHLYEFRFGVFPEANPLATALNLEMRRGRLVNDIRFQYLVLTHPDRHVYGNLDVVTGLELIAEGDAYDFIQDLNERLNIHDFQTLEIRGFLPFEWRGAEITEVRQEIWDARALRHGAEEVISRIVVFEIEGEYFLLFVELINFGGRWYLLEFGGAAGAATNVPGTMFGIMMVNPAYIHLFYEEIGDILITEW